MDKEQILELSRQENKDKDIFELDEGIIDDRFGCAPGEGTRA